MSIYEVHVGSWRKKSANESWSYRELAEPLVDYVTAHGLHARRIHAAWPNTRFIRRGVIRSPAFTRRPAASARRTIFSFSSTRCTKPASASSWTGCRRIFRATNGRWRTSTAPRCYEHEDPRKGAHQDWGTLIFNFGRNEVSNFLVANALFWCDRFHIDGLRVDAVASMLYLDYSRKEGEWIPNQFGGRENLEAIEFLKKFNHITHTEFPGVMTIAEESTAWPQVTRPPYLGGLGFSFKWNMGWMHDTLGYFSREPIHRKYHQNDLTFAMLYHHQRKFHPAAVAR